MPAKRRLKRKTTRNPTEWHEDPASASQRRFGTSIKSTQLGSEPAPPGDRGRNHGSKGGDRPRGGGPDGHTHGRTHRISSEMYSLQKEQGSRKCTTMKSSRMWLTVSPSLLSSCSSALAKALA
jgi:hypothetical protein